MALYKYVKADPEKPRTSLWANMRFNITVSMPQIRIPQIQLPPAFSKQPETALAYVPTEIVTKPRRHKRSRVVKLTSLTLGLTGLLLISWVSYPIVSFEIKSRTKFAQTIEPIPPTDQIMGWEQVNKMNNAAGTIAGAYAEAAPELASGTSTTTGYASISNWLPARQQRGIQTAGRIYYLSIPKLKIKDALVKIAGEDLDKSLIHYGGTGLPGDYGSAVIFGHSILPQFYDPTNYKAIFSKLPDLEKGEDIFIKYDGITYRYEIFNMHVTTPEDISVLEQRYDNSYITLITCVPPGTYWKRLVVQARLIPSDKDHQ